MTFKNEKRGNTIGRGPAIFFPLQTEKNVLLNIQVEMQKIRKQKFKQLSK